VAPAVLQDYEGPRGAANTWCHLSSFPPSASQATITFLQACHGPSLAYARGKAGKLLLVAETAEGRRDTRLTSVLDATAFRE
jgi:hypothetical protein